MIFNHFVLKMLKSTASRTKVNFLLILKKKKNWCLILILTQKIIGIKYKFIFMKNKILKGWSLN